MSLNKNLPKIKLPIEAAAEVFKNLSRVFPCFSLGTKYLQTKCKPAASFPEKIEVAVSFSLKGCHKHPRTQTYALAFLVRELMIYFTLLPQEQQNLFRKDLQSVYDAARTRSMFLLGDFNGDFFENLMKNVFGMSKEIIEDPAEKGFVKQAAEMVMHWPMRLFTKNNYKTCPVHQMAYSELLKEFECAISRDKDRVLNGQNSGEWSVIRELYIRTMERVGTTPSSMKEILFILKIDKACRDYSPSLLIRGGIVGSLRINRKKYLDNTIAALISKPEEYSVGELLRVSKECEYFGIIENILKKLVEEGAEKSDLQPFNSLMEIEVAEALEAPQEARKERSELLAAESHRMCEEVLEEMAKSPSKKRDISILRKEITMVNRILLNQKVDSIMKRNSSSQEDKIDLIVRECEEVWNKFIRKISACKKTEQNLDASNLRSETREELKKEEEIEFSYFSILCSEKMNKTEDTANTEEEPKTEDPTVIRSEKKEKASTQTEEKEELAKIDPSKSISVGEGRADPALIRSATSPSLISATAPSLPSKAVAPPAVSTPISVMSIGQSPKEPVCSDVRCREHKIKEEDVHLLETSAEVDEAEEKKKKPQRLDEIREYFGGLRYACFYSKNFPDPLRHVLKTTPWVYQRIKTLYDRGFTQKLEQGHVSVCRRSLFRDAYIELVNARETSEIVNQLRDEVIVNKYMETLKKQTIEKMIVMEKAEKMKKIEEESQKKQKQKFSTKIIDRIASFFDLCFTKKVPVPTAEEEIDTWEFERRKQMQSEVVFTKNVSDKVSLGFLNVSRALVDLIGHTPGYVYRKQPDAVSPEERYREWIIQEIPVDYNQVRNNPDELRALSMVFNKYIRSFNGGIISKYLYIAVAERAKKVPVDKVDYGLGLLMLATMGANALWLLKHVVYTIEKVAEHEEANFVSYQNIVNIVAQNLLADDVPYTMDTFAVTLELAHSLFAVTRNISFIEEIGE
ncbi:hypothetical protein NEMIN01_0292 [Nematocida minor]|uniref:uncharacterized protein n=1 Tax=Nematocida minor TaxID=1912983 RepID=UPI00221F4E9D|nr:uncharacterized protein NEMIN01_0292 [Nematocida minor]KAI5189126.1 hypothetical protein NEMIN01_0292 [Nematocida minor]